jgi:hypothetical protein
MKRIMMMMMMMKAAEVAGACEVELKASDSVGLLHNEDDSGEEWTREKLVGTC